MYVQRRTKGFGGLGQISSGLATIAATIQQIEGYYPGSVAYANNNPGNLIFVGQAGATQGTPMAGTPYYFASFPSYDAGYAALENQIQIYANQGLTIDQMMAKYAPAQQAGNNPTSYANSIANALGVSTGSTVADAIAGTGTDSSYISDSGDWFETDITDPLDTAFQDLTGDLDSTDTTEAAAINPAFLAVGGILFGLVVLYEAAKS